MEEKKLEKARFIAGCSAWLIRKECKDWEENMGDSMIDIDQFGKGNRTTYFDLFKLMRALNIAVKLVDIIVTDARSQLHSFNEILEKQFESFINES